MNNRGVTIVVCAFCDQPTGLIFDTKRHEIIKSSAVCRCPITNEEEMEFDDESKGE